MAPGPVTAAVACFLCGLAGSAAAGITKFLRGRAGIPVTVRTRDLFVLLAAGTGVQGGGFVLFIGFRGIAGCWLCVFGHSFTNRTGVVR
jgi:hypothetical protein